MRPAVTLAAALLAGAHAAAAQTASPPAAPTAPPPPGSFLLSVGTDALGSDFGSSTPGIAAHGGYERRIGGARSPFSLRLAGDYWRTARTFTGDLRDGSGPMTVHRTTTLVGGSLLGVVRLPTLGALRPYALAGVGVQQYANRNEGDLIPDGPNTAHKVIYLPPVRVNTISYTGGLGASATFGRVTPFAEARLTVLPGLGGLAVPQVRAPLTIGLRF